MTNENVISIEDIVAELKNEEQENTVRLLENACVSAGAGSGKTKVLATRYVYLVAKYGYMPSEILTLTYTNKAANEMYSRIYKSLIEYSEQVTVQVEKNNIKKAIDEFQEAKIQTLDSYCKKLITPYVHKFGISPDFSLDGSKLYEAINQKAVEFLLENRNDPYLQFFLGTKKPDFFAREFFTNIITKYSTIANPINFEESYKKQMEVAKEKWKKYAKEANNFFVDLKKDYLEFGNTATPSAKKTVQELLDKIDFIECEDNPDLLKNNKSIEEWYQWMVAFAKIRTTSARELSVYVEKARDILPNMMSYFNFFFYQEELRGISNLLAKFQSEVEKIKRGMGLLCFADVAALAIECLLKHQEIRDIEKKSYKAIMIDEFQDDNILQKELLYLISEKEDVFNPSIPSVEDLNPNKLFFVGDEKQSIYKFRGADVEVFRKLSSELPGKATLSTNYRSHPALVAAFNSVFGGVEYPIASEADIKNVVEENPNMQFSGGVFRENTPDLESFEATYNLTKAPDFKLQDVNFEPKMHFVLVNEKDSTLEENVEYLSEKESEACFVANKIKKLLEVYEPKDIAILFHRTTNQHVFERFLRNAGIPYSCTKQKSFFYDAPVNDILSFLRVALYQDDMLSIANYLNSPFVRLSENSTNLILSFWEKQKNDKKFFSNPFEDEMYEMIIEKLSDEDKVKFQIAKESVLELRDFVKNHNIAQTITKIFYSFGYCYETMWNDSVSIYSELYDFLFVYATNADKAEKNLSDFILDLEYMEKHPNDMDDISIPLERGNAVQLMTVHGSKGLEFPVVFIVGINDHLKNSGNSENACFNEKLGLAVKLPLHPMLTKDTKKSWVYELTSEEESKKEIAENRRVLYVAITRAETELYLTGKISNFGEKNFFSLLKAPLEKYVDFAEKNEIQGSPFTYEEIGLMQKSETLGTTENQNCCENRIVQIEKKYVDYEKAEVEKTPVILSNKIKPSKIDIDDLLTEKSFILQVNQATNRETENCIFSNLETDKIIEKEIETKGKVYGFNHADFGIVAHSYIEHFFKNKNDDAIENLEPKIPAILVEKLSPTSFEIVKKEGKLLAKGFLDSSLGQKAYNSTWCKNEYDFKLSMMLDGKVSIVDGQIDLIFKDETSGKVVVVDFKSDTNIKILDHIAQLALYKKAAAALCNVEESDVETYLFYLRFCKEISLEKFGL